MTDVGHALVHARALCTALASFQRYAQIGCQVEAGSALSLAVTLASEGLPVIERALAQAQAAEAQQRAQSTLEAFFVGQPRPDLHPSNDDHQPTPFDPLIA